MGLAGQIEACFDVAIRDRAGDEMNSARIRSGDAGRIRCGLAAAASVQLDVGRLHQRTGRRQHLAR